MLVKLLGALDLLSSVLFIMVIFALSPFIQLVVFCSGILFIKGLFILKGEPLSIIDLTASITLVLSVFFSPWIWLLLILSFLLLSKGVVSFI